jgi:hypothetical protein
MADESIIDKLKISEVLDYFSKFILDSDVREIAAGSGNIIAAIFGGVQLIRKFMDGKRTAEERAVMSLSEVLYHFTANYLREICQHQNIDESQLVSDYRDSKSLLKDITDLQRDQLTNKDKTRSYSNNNSTWLPSLPIIQTFKNIVLSLLTKQESIKEEFARDFEDKIAPTLYSDSRLKEFEEIVSFNIYKSHLNKYLRFLVKNYYEKFQDSESPISPSQESPSRSNKNTTYYIKHSNAQLIPIKY